MKYIFALVVCCGVLFSANTDADAATVGGRYFAGETVRGTSLDMSFCPDNTWAFIAGSDFAFGQWSETDLFFVSIVEYEGDLSGIGLYFPRQFMVGFDSSLGLFNVPDTGASTCR